MGYEQSLFKIEADLHKDLNLRNVISLANLLGNKRILLDK